MTQEALKKIDADLSKVVKKYKLHNCAFCGNDEEGHFIGQLLITKTYTQVWETTLNVGRLWQFVREETRKITNKFDTVLGRN